MITQKQWIACASCWLLPQLASVWRHSKTLLEGTYSNNPYSMDLIPHTQNRSFYVLIYPMGPLFILIVQTIGNGILSFGTYLAGITFEYPRLIWYCNYFFIAFINSSLSGWIRASYRCMISEYDPIKAKIWSVIKSIVCVSDWPSISGCSSGITSSRACCGENVCKNVGNMTLLVYYYK